MKLSKYISMIGILTFHLQSFAAPSSNVTFESPEHIHLGEQIVLRYPNKTLEGNAQELMLENGLKISYADLIALGGDFYAVPDSPISLGKTDKDKQENFRSAFNTIAQDPKAVAEVKLLLDDIVAEDKEISTEISNGTLSHEAYKRISNKHLVTQNCITGGFCASDYPDIPNAVIEKIYLLKQGRMLKIAKTNFDHFQQYAWVSYQTGHNLALNLAIEAGKEKNNDKLSLSYAFNAFASHYLSDLYASGHIRTPHYELTQAVTPKIVGSLLANWMHNEEGMEGLTVRNQKGQEWKAYGDTYSLESTNDTNREMAEEALQHSADEIYWAFEHSEKPAEDSVLPLIPDLKMANENLTNNISPLFIWNADKGKLYRRKNTLDKTNFDTTQYWLGWKTLIELHASTSLPTALQAELLSNKITREKALKLGLITDKDLIDNLSKFESTNA